MTTENRGIDFNADTARAIERVYLTPDVVGQRARFLEALDLRPGERVLDVGVGPGLLACDMAATVGSEGAVAGIDASEAMIEMSQRRCADQPWTDFRVADATKLPFGDASFDALVSTQVYEYVPDMAAALAEAFRVLRPGGRILILDTDWDTAVWATSDRERHRRVLDAWDEHLHDPHLPATLAAKLRDAGFRPHRSDVIPIVNTSYQPHSYSFGMVAMIARFVAGRGGVTQEDADDWAADLRALGERDAYFFSINRYLFGATRP